MADGPKDSTGSGGGNAVMVEWQLQDIKPGAAADPAADAVMNSNSTPVTTKEQAQEMVRARMRSHLVNCTSVEGVRIVDQDRLIIARWIYRDEQAEDAELVRRARLSKRLHSEMARDWDKQPKRLKVPKRPSGTATDALLRRADDRLAIVNARKAELTGGRKTGRPDYTASDGLLAAEMRRLIETRAARNVTEAARMVLDVARGKDSNTGKLKRLLRAYRKS